LIEEGRKFVPPWLGPYVIKERLAGVAYLVEDRIGRTSRVHVNRWTRMGTGVEETQDPMAGMFLDSRLLFWKLLGYDAVGKRFEVRSKRCNSFIWTKETTLPDVIVKAYMLDHQTCLPEAKQMSNAKKKGRGRKKQTK
jgi:hypothetical protein